MPKDEWGVKRLCPHCATRFYDLRNDPMTCPSCGATFSLAALLDDGGKPTRRAKDQETKAAEAEVLDDEDMESEDDIDLDDELLEEDEDDDVDLDDIADVSDDGDDE